MSADDAAVRGRGPGLHLFVLIVIYKGHTLTCKLVERVARDARLEARRPEMSATAKCLDVSSRARLR